MQPTTIRARQEALGRVAIWAASTRPTWQPLSPEMNEIVPEAYRIMLTDLPPALRGRVIRAQLDERLDVLRVRDAFVLAVKGEWSMIASGDGATIFTTPSGSERYQGGSPIG